MRVSGLRACYRPAEQLDFCVALHATAAATCSAIELSVVWHTEGKGNEDMTVHYFRRLAASQLAEVASQGRIACSTRLPAGPCSYDGRIVRIRWAVRVRMYMSSGEESLIERPFSLLAAAADAEGGGV